MINVAIGISMRPSDGKPDIVGHQIYGGTASGETAVLAEVRLGEEVRLRDFICAGKAIVNDAAAGIAECKALRSLALTYVVLPNIRGGFPLGQVVKTDVFTKINISTNDPVTSFALYDRAELEKSKKYFSCVEQPNDTLCFYNAVGRASKTLFESHSQMLKILRVKRQGCAIEPKKRAFIAQEVRGSAARPRGNGRALRALSVNPVYTEQDDEDDLFASVVGSTSAIIEACSTNHPSGRPFNAHGPIKSVGPVGYMDPRAAFGEFVFGCFCCFGVGV
jgi:hypothetical protein